MGEDDDRVSVVMGLPFHLQQHKLPKPALGPGEGGRRAHSRVGTASARRRQDPGLPSYTTSDPCPSPARAVALRHVVGELPSSFWLFSRPPGRTPCRCLEMALLLSSRFAFVIRPLETFCALCGWAVSRLEQNLSASSVVGKSLLIFPARPGAVLCRVGRRRWLGCSRHRQRGFIPDRNGNQDLPAGIAQTAC